MAKPFYLSLAEKELVAFKAASFEHIALYLILKKLADFKTGTIGRHPQSKTNCERLAEQLSRPPSQGKPAVTYDRKDISRFLDQMQLRGLVVREPYNDDNNLVLSLPLSPMDYGKKDEASKPATGKAVPEKLPQAASGTSSPGLASVDFEPFIVSPSILVNPFNTFNPPSNEGNDVDDPFENQPLSVEAINALMTSHPTILYAGSEISLALYHQWAKAGVSRAELEKALDEAEADFSLQLKPNEIDAILRAQRTPIKRGKKGGVVL